MDGYTGRIEPISIPAPIPDETRKGPRASDRPVEDTLTWVPGVSIATTQGSSVPIPPKLPVRLIGGGSPAANPCGIRDGTLVICGALGALRAAVAIDELAASTRLTTTTGRGLSRWSGTKALGASARSPIRSGCSIGTITSRAAAQHCKTTDPAHVNRAPGDIRPTCEVTKLCSNIRHHPASE